MTTLSNKNLKIFQDLKALFFGSIGSIAETSELQLNSFNKAFAKFGLDWLWAESEYKKMLLKAGGRNRIKAFSDSTGTNLSDAEIEKIYLLKCEFFIESLGTTKIEPRDGVKELISQCITNNIKLAWVTTTTRENIDAVKKALSGQINFERFEFISNLEHASHPKPFPEIYVNTAEKLNIHVENCLAVEDSTSGVSSSIQAKIFTIAYPGRFLREHDFSQADIQVSDLNDVTLSL